MLFLSFVIIVFQKRNRQRNANDSNMKKRSEFCKKKIGKNEKQKFAQGRKTSEKK